MTGAEISRDEPVGCWKILGFGANYIELREDGTARKKVGMRGGGADLTCPIEWRYIEPSGLEIIYRRAQVDFPDIVSEFRVKYFDGKVLEWWCMRLNDHVVENVMLTEPECWTKTKPPKSWQT